jgi:acetyl-CoA synthetase
MSTGQESAARYERLRAEHRWQVPDRYNIAADVCDARDPDSLAMVHEYFGGAVRAVHWGEPQVLANRAANLLAGLGVERGDRDALGTPSRRCWSPTPTTREAQARAPLVVHRGSRLLVPFDQLPQLADRDA